MAGGTSKRITGDHKWMAATYIPLTEKSAAHGLRRGTVRVASQIKVDVLDVTCEQCRRAYHDVVGQPCVAAFNRDHLIGGPTGERRKREDDEIDDVAL